MGTKYKAEITEEIETKSEWRLFLSNIENRINNTRINISLPAKVKIEVKEVNEDGR